MKQRIWGHVLEAAIRDLSSRNVFTAEERKIETVILFLKPWILFFLLLLLLLLFLLLLKQGELFLCIANKQIKKKFWLLENRKLGGRSRHGSYSNSVIPILVLCDFNMTKKRTPCLTQTPHCHGQPCLCSKNSCFLECLQKKVCV